jgi:aldehyde dehydrogenase (NAD+)
MMMDTKPTLAERFADLAPAPEDASIAALPEVLTNYINGEFVPSSGSHAPVIQSTNPATGEVLYEFSPASVSDVDSAFTAARAGQKKWARLDPSDRAKILFRIARMIAEQSRRLAVVETLDGGKPIRETRDIDVPLAAQHFFHYAGWADKLHLANLGPSPAPLGVAAQVIPWNFPLLMAAWKIAPALACGNAVVLKPAETTSATAYLLAQICAEAGLPDGVVNILLGAAETGRHVVLHEGADKVAFTGSTEVGRSIANSLAGTGRRLTLELGGKGANIVFDDASLDTAVEGIVQGIFFNQGHVCCAGSRLLVQESVANDLLGLLAERASRILVGDPLDKNTEMGAINSRAQLEKIQHLVHLARHEGADLLPVACKIPDRGLFHSPTILTNVSPAATITREEVFGPVLSVSTFRTTAEAIELANNTPYGLACGIFTEHQDRARLVASKLHAGVVWMNTYNVFDPTIAFGGFKESGFGREGGRAGLEAYCV